MTSYYAVCSRTEDTDKETLYRIETEPAHAVLWMSRYLLYHCFGNIPVGELLRLITALDKAFASEKVDNEYHAGGLVYYVRPLSEKEAEDLVTAQDQ